MFEKIKGDSNYISNDVLRFKIKIGGVFGKMFTVLLISGGSMYFIKLKMELQVFSYPRILSSTLCRCSPFEDIESSLITPSKDSWT